MHTLELIKLLQNESTISLYDTMRMKFETFLLLISFEDQVPVNLKAVNDDKIAWQKINTKEKYLNFIKENDLSNYSSILLLENQAAEKTLDNNSPVMIEFLKVERNYALLMKMPHTKAGIAEYLNIIIAEKESGIHQITPSELASEPLADIVIDKNIESAISNGCDTSKLELILRKILLKENQLNARNQKAARDAFRRIRENTQVCINSYKKGEISLNTLKTKVEPFFSNQSADIIELNKHRGIKYILDYLAKALSDFLVFTHVMEAPKGRLSIFSIPTQSAVLVAEFKNEMDGLKNN